ncbi:MAG: helix-turn-helix domain-containing protein [Myxococcota bacterium]
MGLSALKLRIVDTAIEYMTAFGSEKLNVREVARHAGVGRATIHKHFGTKQGLLEAAEARIAEQMVEVLTDVAASIDGLHLQAAAIATRIRRSRVDRSITPWIGFFSPLEEGALLVTHAGEHIRSLCDVFRPLVAMAQERGEIRAELDAGRTSEWIARISLTFALAPANLNIDDEGSVREFFREHLAGLA